MAYQVASSTTQVEAPFCPLCTSQVTVPARLPCGHLVDFHCISKWINNARCTSALKLPAAFMITLGEVNPENAVTVRSLKINLLFSVHISTRISSLIETFAACQSPHFAEMSGAYLENESTGCKQSYGYFLPDNPTTLKELGIPAGTQLRIITSLTLSWNPEA